MTKYRVTFITGSQSYEVIEVEGLMKLKIVCMGIRANNFEIHTIEKMVHDIWDNDTLFREYILNIVEKKLESLSQTMQNAQDLVRESGYHLCRNIRQSR